MSKTHLRAPLIPKFSGGDTHGSPVKRGWAEGNVSRA